MHDVRPGKINDTVAIGVAILKMPNLDIFAIEMNRDVVVKPDTVAALSFTLDLGSTFTSDRG